MTGWVDGKYSKWHCEAPRYTESGEIIPRCNRPATLRKFRDKNVPLCDDCFKLLKMADDLEK